MNLLTNLNWSEEQIDALQEIMNIGIGIAAKSLSEMVSEEVLLNIPNIQLLSRSDISKMLEAQNPEGMSYVFQDFKGTFFGRSALIFPIHKSFNLVKALLKDLVLDDDMTEMEQEALSEVGNVILNACISTLVNCLDVKIEVQIPSYVRGGPVDILLEGDPQLDHNPTNLFCAVNFSTKESGIEGHVLFLLELPSIEILRRSLEEYLSEQV